MIEDDETIDVFNGVEFGMTDHPAVALSSGRQEAPVVIPCLRTRPGSKMDESVGHRRCAPTSSISSGVFETCPLSSWSGTEIHDAKKGFLLRAVCDPDTKAPVSGGPDGGRMSMAARLDGRRIGAWYRYW
jgi:hypothetical protein